MSILEEDQLVYDPLTQITRTERKVLLGTSGLGIAIAKIPLVPSKISVLGIEFQAANQYAFLTMYALLVGFFLLAFAVYGLSDLVRWRRALTIRSYEYTRANTLRNLELKKRQHSAFVESLDSPTSHPFPSMTYEGWSSWSTAHRTIVVRAAFEFGIPVVIGGLAIMLLLQLARNL